MKMCLIQLIFIAIGLSLVKSDCAFNRFANNYQPMFFQKVYSQTFFVPINNNTIYIPEEGSVQAYCSEGFWNIDERNKYRGRFTYYEVKEITIECRNSEIRVTNQGENYSPHIQLQCNKPTISLHSVHTHMCGRDNNAFIMSLEYYSHKLAFAEICYDFEVMELKYIYHKAARRSARLSEEKKNSVITTDYRNPVELVSNRLSISDDEIKSQTKALFGSVAGAVEYVYDHLVPLDTFDPFVTDSMDRATHLTKILWWKPLKEGNWRLFLDLLKKHSQQNSYSVITGVSGAVAYYQKNCGEFKNLKFEANGLIKTPPKIIWSYLIMNPQRDNGLNNTSNYRREEESFVVIGYNTPFFDKITPHPYTMCKNDRCSRIPWLRNLSESQKRVTFGYMSCCTPEEAKIFIPEIPKNITSLGQLIPELKKDIPDLVQPIPDADGTNSNKQEEVYPDADRATLRALFRRVQK